MSPKPGQTITQHFACLPDPRLGNVKQHLLGDIPVIAICAIICGADTWVEVEAWGNATMTNSTERSLKKKTGIRIPMGALFSEGDRRRLHKGWDMVQPHFVLIQLYRMRDWRRILGIRTAKCYPNKSYLVWNRTCKRRESPPPFG